MNHESIMHQKILGIPLFKDLNIEKTREISAYFKLHTYKKGAEPFDYIITKSKFYIITKGCLKVYQVNEESGREFTIFLLRTNDVFDIFTLMDNEEHDVMTEVLEDMEVLEVRLERMREWIENDPKLLKAFFPHLGKRLRMLEQTTVDICLSNTSVRLAKLILDNMANNVQLTHDEMAGIIGTTRAVVNRHIQEIKKNGIIKVQRKQILVKEIAELQRLAGILG
jgi:CRP/FNR family transcriptional regulator